MNWKERFKPDNNAEKTLYIGILIVGGLSLFISYGDKLGFPESLIFRTILISTIIFAIAHQIYHQVQTKYLVSKIKNLFISGVWATILLSTGVFIFGASLILASLIFSFLPQWTEWIITILWFVGLIFFGVKSSSIVDPIQTFIFERILKLSTTERPPD